MKALVSKSLVSLVAFGFVNMASAAIIYNNGETNRLKINWLSKYAEEVSRADISSVRHELNSQNWFRYSNTNAVIPDALAIDIQSIIDDLEVDFKETGSNDYSELSFVNPEREIVPITVPIDSSETYVSVPEPATFGMLLLGLLGLWLARKRMSKV